MSARRGTPTPGTAHAHPPYTRDVRPRSIPGTESEKRGSAGEGSPCASAGSATARRTQGVSAAVAAGATAPTPPPAAARTSLTPTATAPPPPVTATAPTASLRQPRSQHHPHHQSLFKPQQPSHCRSRKHSILQSLPQPGLPPSPTTNTSLPPPEPQHLWVTSQQESRTPQVTTTAGTTAPTSHRHSRNHSTYQSLPLPGPQHAPITAIFKVTARTLHCQLWGTRQTPVHCHRYDHSLPQRHC